MSQPTNQAPANVLTAEEEVTLRRVAFGQSEERAMRAQDLARLRTLRLIEASKDGPRLTARGKEMFDALPKPTSLTQKGDYDSLLTSMTRLLGDSRR
jgi:hypothetical protein